MLVYIQAWIHIPMYEHFFQTFISVYVFFMSLTFQYASQIKSDLCMTDGE